MIHAITSGQGLGKQQLINIKTVAEKVDAVVIREKHLSIQEIEQGIIQLLALGVERCKLILHTHVTLAQKYALLGCHFAAGEVPLHKPPSLLYGQSTHNLTEVKKSEIDGMDYIYYSPIFPTTSKPHAQGQGLTNLAKICQQTTLPVIALGGVTTHRIPAIYASGAKGYASISLFFH